MQFEDLKLKRQFLNTVSDLGFVKPTPIQIQAIPRILAGQDVIGVAQTGTGKTGAYVLPLLQKLRGVKMVHRGWPFGPRKSSRCRPVT